MRVAWSTLIVLVLLAPFGRVGITAAPSDADAITAPRASSAGAQQLAPAMPEPPRAAHAWIAVPVDVAAYILPRVDTLTVAAAPTAPVLATREATDPARARAPPSVRA